MAADAGVAALAVARGVADAAAASPAATPAPSVTLGLVLAFVASASNNIGKALQKRGMEDLPRMSLERKVLGAYARHSTWRLGFIADLGGAVLMLFALQSAPLSMVQPIAGSGIAVLAVFSHLYLREELRPLEWAGVAVAAAGAVGVGCVVAPEPGGGERLQPGWAALGVVGCLCCALAGLEAAVRAVQLRERAALCELSAGGRSVHELASGVQGGILFGLSAAASRTGLLLSRQRDSAALIALGVAASVLLTSAGFFLQARGLKDGRAVIVCTYAAISTISSGVLIGVVALSEPLPRTGPELAGWWLSLAAILGGVTLLVQRGVGAAKPAGAKHDV